MPVTGMMPIVIPTFSKIWNISMASTPTHTSMPNSSRASCAVRQMRQTMMQNSASSVAGADEAELLAHRGEDEVGVLLGHVAEPGLAALEQSLAERAAGADRGLRLVDVVLRLRECGVVLGRHVLGQERSEPRRLVLLQHAGVQRQT